MLREHETAVDEAPLMASFPANQHELNNASYWHTRASAERDWFAGWQVRMRQALAIVNEQMGRR
jgi:hypothetical protein